MDKTIEKVNVEEIMAEIRREIIEKGYKNEDILFSEIPIRSIVDNLTHSGMFKENLAKLKENSSIAVHRPLRSNRILGFFFVFIRKIIRKLIKFYVEPIVNDQNRINEQSISCLQDLYVDMEIMQQRFKTLEDEIIQLKEKLEAQ